MDKFAEINEAINRKLEGKLYLIDNRYIISSLRISIHIGKIKTKLWFCRFSEADIILYCYIRVLKTYPELFGEATNTIQQFSNIVDFYANLSVKYDEILDNYFKN